MKIVVVLALVGAGFLLGNASGYVSGVVEAGGVCDGIAAGLYK